MAQAWGAFQLLERISESEATETFRAQNERGEHVWLKRARAQAMKDEGFAPLFLADLAAAAALKHPSVLPLLAAGEVGGVPFLVQPVVPGWTLGELLQQARGSPLLPLSAPLAAAVVTPVLEALAAAHAMAPPLLHRDLGPDNVVVTEQGRVLLANFGLARARQRAGTAKGLSRAYVSPEQARGLPIDARSEVFAAGLLLFELSCGRLPAEGTAGDVISRIASSELDPPEKVNPHLDPKLVAVLHRALAPSPDARFPSAAAFAEALRPLVPPDPDAKVGRWADETDEGVPTQSRKAPNLTSSVATAPAEVAAATATPSKSAPGVPEAVTPLAPRPPAASGVEKPRRRRAWLPLAGVALVLAGWLGWDQLRPLMRAHHAPWPKTTVTSVPNGAEVWVDGERVKDVFTPAEVELEPTAIHELQLRYGSLRSQGVKVQNATRVEVNLNTGEVSAERRAVGAPPRPAPPVEPVKPPPTRNAAPEPAHQTAVLPVDVVLDGHFQLPVDNMGSREMLKGERLEEREAASLFKNDTPYGNPAEKLDTWALWLEGGALKIHRMSSPLISTANRSYYLFGVSRVGGTHEPAVMRHDEKEVNISGLAVAETKNLFEISPLDPAATYCVRVTPNDEAAPPLPLPPVLMGVGDWTGDDDAPELDGAQVEGVVLLTNGEHTLRHALSAWFTLPTIEGSNPPRVHLTLAACKVDSRRLPLIKVK